MTKRLNTDFVPSVAARRLTRVLAAAALVLGAGVSAQTLSSPISPGNGSESGGASGGGSAGVNGKGSATTAPGAGLPIGQGPGVHGANSPFPNLSARDDVVPWSLLTAVKTKREKNRVFPVFSMDQMALRQKTVRIQGFMMPLDPGEKQTHFLLSSVPMTCAFCTPGGPESMVEVKTKAGVRYSMEPVVVEGRFMVLDDDPQGLYYRVTEAVSVK